jgi:hypothetical protein
MFLCRSIAGRKKKDCPECDKKYDQPGQYPGPMQKTIIHYDHDITA